MYALYAHKRQKVIRSEIFPAACAHATKCAAFACTSFDDARLFLFPRAGRSISASSRYARRADQFLDRDHLCAITFQSGMPLQTIMAPPVTARESCRPTRVLHVRRAMKNRIRALVKLKGLMGTQSSPLLQTSASYPMINIYESR